MSCPSQGSRGGGGEKPDFLRSKNVALCLFTSKAMAALRWFLPRENNSIIDRVIKLKILAILWFSLKSLAFFMTGRRNRAHAPSRFLPPRPSLPSGFIMDQKIGQWKFFASENSREVRCEHHLVAGLFVCEYFLLAGRRKRCGVNTAVSTLRRRAAPYTVAKNFCSFRLRTNLINYFY